MRINLKEIRKSEKNVKSEKKERWKKLRNVATMRKKKERGKERKG